MLITGPYRALLTQSIDPDALKWYATVIVAGGTCSRNQLKRISQLIRALKAAGVWTLLDRIWLFAAENAQQALIDLVARSTATAVNSPTFTAGQGYAGNGTTSYVNTNFNFSTGPKFTQNSGHFGVWRRVANTSAQNGQDGALVTSPSTQVTSIEFTDNSIPNIAINCGTALTATGAGGTGHLVGNRSDASTQAAYYNGVQVAINAATASTGAPNVTAFIGVRNFAGSPNQFGNHQTLACHMGASLTGAQDLAIYNALNAYKTAIGA